LGGSPNGARNQCQDPSDLACRNRPDGPGLFIALKEDGLK